MTIRQIPATESRLRPAFVATLVAITFVIGIGAGFVLSQVVASHPAVATGAQVLPLAGDDMSAAAYAAGHATDARVMGAPRDDMSAAVYAAQHARALTGIAAPLNDMTAAACSLHL
jgi:hypothetical protein